MLSYPRSVSRSVLVARSDNLGDVLLTGPAVRAIAGSTADVHYLCSPQGRPAASLLPGVKSVLTAAVPWIDATAPPATPEWAEDLTATVRGVEPDEAVIFTSFHQSPLPLALLLRLAGVARISAISVDYPGSLLDLRHSVDEDMHEVERGLSLAAAAGYQLPPGDDRRLRIDLPAGAERSARALLPSRWWEEGYVVVHPGASVPARAWEAEHHGDLVDALTSRGRRVVITGAPSERFLAAHLRSRAASPDRVMDLSGRTDFASLAVTIAGGDAIVCGNTGPAHIAAAVGTPVVSIYAPTVPAVRWRPWMVPHVILGRQDIGCSGCRARRCPIAEHPCVSGIPVASVVDALESVRRRREAVLS